jgi:hypothetical protein
LNLFHKTGGVCYWCGCQTALPPSGVSVKEPPPNEATVDHLDERFSGRKGSHPNGVERTVLACRACNEARGNRMYKALPVEQRRAMSIRGGRS